MTPSLPLVSWHSALLCVLITFLLANVVAAQTPTPTPPVEQPRPVLDPERARGRPAQQQVIVERAVESYTSPPLRSLAPVIPEFQIVPAEQPRPRLDPERARGRREGEPDKVLQLSPGPRATIELGPNFQGITGGGLPPDPTGAAGESQYVQAVNASLAVFDKRTGQVIHGPVVISSLWRAVNSSSPCARFNHGDPIVVYDRIARRWLISQFLLTGDPWGECVAVSTTEDATGSYHLYLFTYPNFPDYPKFGVWPDAYYVSYNMFGGPTGGRACALEREKMLRGAPAAETRQVCFQIGFYNLLPSDFDGRDLPPAGSPNYFLRRSGDGRSLALRKFHVDWSNPGNSTFGVGASSAPDAEIPVEPFNDSCGGGTCIPQRGTGQLLDSLGERLMYRVAYRRFADRESLVANHSVEPTNAARAGIRWYEIRNPNSSPTVFQQGTFVPDTRSRWMGSVAMDAAGNIAAGYSISGPDISPGIRIATRGPSDPPGVLGSETLIADGESQTGALRWGDYSQMSIDPVDDCTFWFTAEYITGGRRSTRIASFKVNNCSSGGGGGGGGGGGASGRIVFVSNRDGNMDIYSMNADGSDVRRLTTDPASDYSPAISPDGRSIVFVSERDGGNPEIYVMDVNGGNQRRLTSNPALDKQPTWVPRVEGRAGSSGPGLPGGSPSASDRKVLTPSPIPAKAGAVNERRSP